MTHSPKRQSGKFLLRGSTALLTVALAAAVAVTSPVGPEPIASTAQAQNISLTVQFRSALAPHGRWSRHDRWGEVWIPARRDRDWRPYTEGRWVYTDEWGWFWDSDEEFGWIAYHYGRWVLDAQLGWIWIPGNEWGPAWVQWRRGDRHAGWAPLPPQQVIYEYDDDPNYWVFVSFNNFTAPNIRRVVVPPRERVVYIQQTVIVNRTIIVEGDRDRDRRSRIAVNPGIAPSIVAARTGRALRVAEVQPVVVTGTVGVRGATEIRGDERRDRGKQGRVSARITEKQETIAPAKDVAPPQALKKGEEGRLGDRPPEAAKGQATTQPDTAKGKQDVDQAKGKQDVDQAKGKQDVDQAKGKQDVDRAKGKQDPDLAKGKAKEGDAKAKDAAKSTPVDTKDEPKSRAKDATKTDPAAGAAKTTKGDDIKGEPKSKAKDVGEKGPGEKGKQPPTVGKSTEPETKAAPKSESRREPEKGQEKQSVTPKAPEQPRQAAPQPKEQPRAGGPDSGPKGGDSGPKGGAQKQDGPKGPPAKGKDQDQEKGKGG